MLSIPNKQAWIAPFIIAGLSMLGSIYATYTHDDKDLTARIAKLEAHREDDSSKLDHIQQQLDRLVGWAIGK